MSARRYPTAELYQEQERDFYARPRNDRNYDELDIDISRERERRPARADTVISEARRPARREPDFLRDDYGRTDAGALVIHQREQEVERDRGRDNYSQVGSRRGGPPRPPTYVAKDEMIIRERSRDNFSDTGKSRRGGRERADRDDDARSDVRDRPRGGGYREVDKEEIIIRRGGERERERDPEPPRRREREVEDTEISIRRGESQPARRREREVDREEIREDIVFRRGEGEWIPPRRDRDEESEWKPPRRNREIDREDIHIREEIRGPPRDPPRSEHGDRGDRGGDRGGSEREVDREEIRIRERERSLPPQRRRSILVPIAREREDFVFRRREPSPPPPPPAIEREQIVIRRRERSPSPPPPPPAIEREEIVIRRRERSPSPRRPPPRDYEKEEIIIRRRERERTPPREPSPEPEPEPEREPSPEPLPPIIRPPIIQEIITHHRHIDHGVERARSPTPPPPAPPSPPPPPAPVQTREDLEIEIRRRGTRNGQDFYEKDVIYERERENVVEPPPRREEEMQITRRRSFSAQRSRQGDNRRDSGRQVRRDMWTELTKDLVIKEAIEELGYEYEENPNNFYVIEYLHYEDVVRLVELSEDIRRQRRERLREIAWEKEETERAQRIPPPPIGRKYEERIVYERDYIHDTRRNGRHR